MALQILVNHYNEDIDIVEKFLQSLSKQKNINFEVIIISDGGKINLFNEINFSKYPFQITYQYINHGGTSYIRNALLNKATADYIMFCDIDDEFENENGIKNIFNKIQEENGDIIGTPIKQENIDNSFIILNKNIIFLQGKIFKRQFLIDNKIQFYNELETQGDMMFLWLAYALSNKTIWTEDIFYIWKNNPNSVTRKDKEFYHIISLPNVIYGYTLLGKELIQRNRLDLLQFLVPTVISMIYIYSTLINQDNGCPKHFKDSANKAINHYLNNYFNFYKQLDQNFRKQRYDLMFNYYNPPKELYNFDKLISWGERQIKQTNTLIIGYGIVGKNLEKELKSLNPDVYDKYNNYYWIPKMKKYKTAFICVPTPKTDNEDCDISEVKNAILENDAEIYVVKSTVLPSTIEKLIQETGKHIVFSPEYYGETQHCNNYDFDFTILGGNKQDCIKVQQLLQKCYDGRHKFYITDSKTAELTKYMENSYLATKVSFCQQFFNLAEEIGVNYEELRELFVLDPRVNPSHTFVYREQPYWDSKCLNKDVPAIANTFNAPLLKSVIEFNENQKKGKV